ncbi:hypothetical protein [Algoriphagus persicinus]|uniref:hypothetical protein n=1 Tax=Algoriphagus persicinus TaxID=3108754 RepID=UPI002B3D250E|nr:hypothetical protein [Algoriphagus sp. E1-3-M2]MEB2787398.1 hypothetical protein [Algoriphagus sp. E1-3-M2]
MKSYVLLLTIFLFLQGQFICKAQEGFVKEISKDNVANYLLANIKEINYSFHELHDRSFFINVYTLDDSMATPKSSFQEYDGILSSLLISIIPDGDYYVQSKLFKIEGLENPVILGISEKSFPEFIVSVESGGVNKRKNYDYKFSGAFK